MKKLHLYRTLTSCLGILLLANFFSCNKTLEQKPSVLEAALSDMGTAARLKPNVILIIGDDVGFEIPNYTGGESYSTPNINALAANGMQFPNFKPHPDGPPSRLALMTGKYNFRNWEKFGYLPTNEKSIGNLMQNAGYATCFAGKWQLGGGDTSIRNHGFAQYRVFMPFKPEENNGYDQYTRRYKNPYLYENAGYLPDTMVEGKYSEDLLYEYASNFIDSNLSKPFFLVYSHNLVQRPGSPPPDHPDYAAWNPEVDDQRDDPIYFPYMVAYMDKIVGQLVNKVNSAGIMNRTVIIYMSDNATNKDLTSIFQGQDYQGGKGSSLNAKMRIPFIAYSPGNIAAGAVDTSLVDMTDILPTLADIAGVRKPTTWGTLDGVTFSDNLIGRPANARQRKTVYCYWPRDYQKQPDKSFIFDYTYKLYDSLNGGGFFNMQSDPDELNPIPDNQLTPAELQKKTSYKNILNSVLNQ